MFASEITRKRSNQARSHSNWQWHLDEVFVKINGERYYLWCAVDHEGEVNENYVSKRRDRKAALKFIRKSTKRSGQPRIIVTDKLSSYRAAMVIIGNSAKISTNGNVTEIRLGPRVYSEPFQSGTPSLFTH
jgi:putative transposase